MLQEIRIEKIDENTFIYEVRKDKCILGSGIANNNVEAFQYASEKFMELLNKKYFE